MATQDGTLIEWQVNFMIGPRAYSENLKQNEDGSVNTMWGRKSCIDDVIAYLRHGHGLVNSDSVEVYKLTYALESSYRYANYGSDGKISGWNDSPKYRLVNREKYYPKTLREHNMKINEKQLRRIIRESLLELGMGGETLTFAPYDYEGEGDGCYGGRTYLHGELEMRCGNDLCTPLNAVSAGYAKPQIGWSSLNGNQVVDMGDKENRYVMYANGAVPCKVLGIDEPCTGYFWTIEERPIYYQGKSFPYWEQAGLIVLDSDERGKAQAEQMLRQKPRWF